MAIQLEKRHSMPGKPRLRKTWRRVLLVAVFLVLLIPSLEHVRRQQILIGRWESRGEATYMSVGEGVLVIDRDGTFRSCYGPKSVIGNEGNYWFKGIFTLQTHMTGYWGMNLNEDGSVGDDGPGGRVDTSSGYQGTDHSMIDGISKVWINWRGDQMTLQSVGDPTSWNKSG